MKNNQERALWSPYLGRLPAWVKTRGGAVFDPSLDYWIVDEGTVSVALNFALLPPMMPEIVAGLKSTLVWYAENRSAEHLDNMFARARGLLSFTYETGNVPVAYIDSTSLLNYRASLDKSTEWYLGNLRGFLKKWHAMGLAGVTDDAIRLLQQLKLKGNAKGVAVATMDPNKGPFTDIEWESVQQALNDAYARNGVSLQEYVLVWLFALLGLRPTQYARLKLCDVSVATSEKDGAFVYSIRVPRAKTREGNPRAQFADRVLIPQVGEVVLELTSQVEARFVGILDDPRQAPLFPLGHEGSAPIGFEYHATTEQIRNKLARVLNALKVVSERTGKPMNIMATRFRRTLGTRAAAEGHGELVIAELLDHSDTQNVGVYVNATPAIIERIDKAIAMRMAPLAQAFAGKLINGPAEATRATDSSSNISAPHITKSFKSIASCGMHGFCGFLKPVACYTCRSFEPWVDGPHEAVLDHLLAERERLLLTTDSRIASINDRTILAVAEVVHRCEQARREKDASHG